MYGVRGVALSWFKSYLHNRVQYVDYNGMQHDKQTIRCGVPQGSILGPLLFLLYDNDRSDVSSRLYSLLFADDSNLFMSDKNINDLIENMNCEMKDVVDWLQVNKLSLNLKKTHSMLFRKRRKRVFIERDLVVNDTIIPMVDKTKFLGVVIDECLTFSQHIQYTKGKNF